MNQSGFPHWFGGIAKPQSLTAGKMQSLQVAARRMGYWVLEEGPKWKTHKIIFALSLQSRNMKASNIHFGVPCGMDECVLKVVFSLYSVPSYQFGSVFQLKLQTAHQTSNQPCNILPPTTRPATLVGVQGLCHGPCHDPGRGPGKTKNGLSWRAQNKKLFVLQTEKTTAFHDWGFWSHHSWTNSAAKKWENEPNSPHLSEKK